MLSMSSVAQRSRRNRNRMPQDTVAVDTLSADTLGEKKKKQPLDAPVIYEANDSIVFTQGGFVHLFGDGKVNYEDIELTAPPSLLKQYKQFERDKVLECLDEEGEIVAGTAAALLGKLTQFTGGSIYDLDSKAHHIHDVKLDALEELIEEAGGGPVLVLYGYKHEAERIRERIKCRNLDTPDDLDAWNRGEIPVALAHPASCAHGLNLQQGGHITIWYSLTFSCELYEQANERLYRPGQQHVCCVYHLLLKGTVDEKIKKALEHKSRGQAIAIEALRLEVLEEIKRG